MFNDNDFIIIDISSDKLSLAIGANQKILNIQHYQAFDYDGYQEGEFLSPNEIGDIIALLIKNANIMSNSTIVIGVPGEFTTVVTKNVDHAFGTNHKVTSKDLDFLFAKGNTYIGNERYVTLNASPIHYMTDSASIILDPIGLITNRLTSFVSYTLCERYFINIFDKISKKLNMNFIYNSSVLATSMYVASAEQRDSGLILVDCGYISSTVAYIKGDGILHSVSFSLGGGNVAADITTVLDIPFEHSLALYNKLNLNLNPSEDDNYTINVDGENFSYNIKNINEISTARIANFSENVEQAIDLYANEIPPYTPIFLTGGGLSAVIGARECISISTQRGVEILSPDLVGYNKPKYSSVVATLMLASKMTAKTTIKSMFINLFSRLRRKHNVK